MSKISNQLLNAAVVIVTVIAGVSVAFRVRDAVRAHRAQQAVLPTQIDDWRTYATSGVRLGPTLAPVTVVMFSDFQCPFCRAVSGELRALRRKDPDGLAVVYRHYPLTGHTQAIPASRAVICAARQARFEAMQVRLFQDQDSLGTRPWIEYARDVGIANLDAFNTCLNDATVLDEIRRDSVAGEKLGVSGTPTLLINSTRVVGDPGIASLETYIANARR